MLSSCPFNFHYPSFVLVSCLLSFFPSSLLSSCFSFNLPSLLLLPYPPLLSACLLPFLSYTPPLFFISSSFFLPLFSSPSNFFTLAFPFYPPLFSVFLSFPLLCDLFSPLLIYFLLPLLSSPLLLLNLLLLFIPISPFSLFIYPPLVFSPIPSPPFLFFTLLPSSLLSSCSISSPCLLPVCPILCTVSCPLTLLRETCLIAALGSIKGQRMCDQANDN